MSESGYASIPVRRRCSCRRGRVRCSGIRAVAQAPDLDLGGATRDEVDRQYPGDELIPDPDDGSTMATTLPVPPERVWPWLAQMGGDRGGWYSRGWLDNNGKPSADRIVPEWQELHEGQQLSRVATPGEEPGSFTVVTLEPNRTLVLRSSYGLFTGRDFDPASGPAPLPWVDGIWVSICDPRREGRRGWSPGHETEVAHAR